MKSRSFWIALSFSFLVFSCDTESTENTSATASKDSTQLKDEIILKEDSLIFHIGNHTFEVSASSINDFNAVADPFKITDTSEAGRIKKQGAAVSRSSDSLIFNCSNNKISYLINNNDEDDVDNYCAYTFIKDMPQINQWLIMASYYESGGYVLIDKTTGDSTLLYGMPVVSPDNKYILTFNQDLEAGFTFNGFQLFEMKDSKPVELGEKELLSWGPDNVRWKDAQTLLVLQAKSDSKMNITNEYIQIRMK